MKVLIPILLLTGIFILAFIAIAIFISAIDRCPKCKKGYLVSSPEKESNKNKIIERCNNPDCDFKKLRDWPTASDFLYAMYYHNNNII